MGEDVGAHLLRRMKVQLDEGKISPQDYAVAKSAICRHASRGRRKGFFSKIMIGVIALFAVGAVTAGLTKQSVSDQENSTPAATTPPVDDGARVTAAQYGEDWPFPFQAATLRCHTRRVGGTIRSVITLRAEGVEVALNGVARGLQEYEDYQRYMWPRDAVTGAFLKGVKTVSVLIEKGGSLCQ